MYISCEDEGAEVARYEFLEAATGTVASARRQRVRKRVRRGVGGGRGPRSSARSAVVGARPRLVLDGAQGSFAASAAGQGLGLQAGGALTVALWAWLPRAIAGGSWYDSLVSCRAGAPPGNGDEHAYGETVWGLGAGGRAVWNGPALYVTAGDAASATDGSGRLPLERWVHLAASFDPASGALSLYGRRVGQRARRRGCRGGNDDADAAAAQRRSSPAPASTTSRPTPTITSRSSSRAAARSPTCDLRAGGAATVAALAAEGGTRCAPLVRRDAPASCVGVRCGAAVTGDTTGLPNLAGTNAGGDLAATLSSPVSNLRLDSCASDLTRTCARFRSTRSRPTTRRRAATRAVTTA